jgi:hypothetical protein
MMKKVSLILCCLFISLNFHPGLCDDKQVAGERVTVEGRSTLAGLDIEKARDRAIEDALRKAVEQGVGVHISSQSLIKNYKMIDDKILAKSSGYVQQYKITDEKQQHGFYIVTISTVVKMGDLKQDPIAIKTLINFYNPGMLVLIYENYAAPLSPVNIKKFSPRQQSQVEASLAAAFKNKGFYVLDSNAKKVKSRWRKGKSLNVLQNYASAARDLGKALNVEFVFIGEVDYRKNGQISGTHFTSVTAVLTIKALRADTGEIVTSRTWNMAGAGLSDLAAANNAAKRVSDIAGDHLISVLLDTLRASIYDTHIIRLMVYNLSDHSLLHLLEQELKNKVPGIKVLYRRSFEKRTVIYDAAVKGKSENIANALHERNFGGLKTQVIGGSQNVIKLKVVQN